MSFRPRVAACTALVALAAAFCPAAARAADPPSEADTLFEDGRRLMEQGSLEEACATLEKSLQLAPRLGTMLNLGGCLERRGQLARAIALYERAASLARQLGRSDREAAAREFAAALEPRVAKLLVIADEPALVTQVDGETISTRSGLVPLDPGPRRLVARMPGRVPFELVLDLHAGETRTVTIPRLAEEPKRAAPPPASSGSSLRTAGLATGFGLAAVGLGLGTFFGLEARAKHEDSLAECDAAGCSEKGLTFIHDAKAAGNASTALFVAGATALAATVVVLVLTRRSRDVAQSPVAVAW
jgi:tetratricopeptide (TPR) repeat protein